MTGLPSRLDKFVSPEPMSGCWLWLGAVDGDNYGMGVGQAPKNSPGLWKHLEV